MSIISIKNLTYQYPTSEEDVLRDISVEFESGKFYAVIGANGAGKTSLCNAIRGFIPHFYNGELQGDVLIEGRDIREWELGELSTKIGYVFQNPFTQISGVKDTVFDEISFGLENLGVEESEIRSRVADIIQLLEIGHLQEKNPFELSGGQKQRVALASIIVMEPEILVIDEPTSQLDPQSTEAIFSIIELMQKKGKTIILVEHKIELIAEYADYIIVMKDGKAVLQGNADDVLSNEQAIELGCALPQYALFGIEMKENGMDLGTIPLTEKKAISAVQHLLEKRRVTS
ncbi:ABC transporter ATP-binding protein [Virgibacillus profundi]|uniref:ABC transporter ATP-binding protein n=1 Tax=Virgibacillus profundi TaxID=2024555 RepID=A0A2A2I9K7_9BACI|nr:ABC transporter ATP-binding protein [Virgibacillus profundi]PAV28409.1 ABC transporter ATP-binding protein [Virgibacillus profundi]PXY52229.1 ABC transporter ATP-binding protein [Virgibacillus profundi]